MNDKLYMQYTIWRGDYKGSEMLHPILQTLDKSFLHKPNRIDITDTQTIHVDGYLDDKIIRALDRKKHSVELYDEDNNLHIIINQGIKVTDFLIALETNYISTINPEDLKQLFVSFIHIIRPSIAFCHFRAHKKKLFDEFYSKSERTTRISGLTWLTFMDSVEEERQGGRKLEHNAYAIVQRLPEGLLFQVGQSPFDALTPKGENLLVNATQAMPPVSG